MKLSRYQQKFYMSCKFPATTGKSLPIICLQATLWSCCCPYLRLTVPQREEFNKSLDVWVFTPSRPLAVDSGCYISQNFSGPISSSVKQKAWKRWLRSSSSSKILFEMLSVLIMSQRERIQLSREFAQPPLKERGSAIVETESSQGGTLEKPGAQVQAIQKGLCKHRLKAQPRLSGLNT